MLHLLSPFVSFLRCYKPISNKGGNVPQTAKVYNIAGGNASITLYLLRNFPNKRYYSKVYISRRAQRRTRREVTWSKMDVFLSPFAKQMAGRSHSRSAAASPRGTLPPRSPVIVKLPEYGILNGLMPTVPRAAGKALSLRNRPFTDKGRRHKHQFECAPRFKLDKPI